MKAYLIGFMGCGKSSIGKRIADRLGWKFIDMDDVIEEAAGMSIPEIFAAEGEDAFRQRERAVLEKTFKKDKVLVATGGGCPCYFDNMERINANGVSIHLRNDIDFFVDKLRGNTKRPLVAGKSKKELREYITETFEKRNPYYFQAHYVVHTRNHAKNKVAKLVANMLTTLDEG